MNKVSAGAFCAYVLFSSGLFAQTAIAQSYAVVAPAPTAVLRAGTSIALRTVTPLTTEGKALKPGQRFNLETTDPISLNGQVVIPSGSRAVGEVTEVRNKGMWGKSGRIAARLIHVQIGDRRVRISGTIDDKGATGTGGVVAAAAFVPVVGFFVTGTSAQIPAGSGITAYLEEDVPVQFVASAPAPMVVATPAAVLTTSVSQ